MHWRSAIHNEPGRWYKLIVGVGAGRRLSMNFIWRYGPAGDLCRMAVIVGSSSQLRGTEMSLL